MLVKHEAYLDRQFVHALFHILVESFGVSQSHGILFSGDDDARLRHSLEGFVDTIDVLTLEVVVVAEGE